MRRNPRDGKGSPAPGEHSSEGRWGGGSERARPSSPMLCEIRWSCLCFPLFQTQAPRWVTTNSQPLFTLTLTPCASLLVKGFASIITLFSQASGSTVYRYSKPILEAGFSRELLSISLRATLVLYDLFCFEQRL